MSRMKFNLVVIFLVFSKWLFSQQPQGTLAQPLWLKSRPNSAFKYVGIGFAEKSKGQSYIMEAKKNALFDLASEIKVDISSNSVLYSVQNNKQYNESFNSLIKLSNSEYLEGYQLIDSYEDQNTYWVYYQLDKDLYAKTKAQKKQRILDQAAQFLNLALQDEKSGQMVSALTKRLQAFSLLVPYLNEELHLNASLSGGVTEPTDITALIQSQFQDLKLTSVQPVFKAAQAQYAPVPITINAPKGKLWTHMPFRVIPESEHVSAESPEIVNNQNQIVLKLTEIGNDVNLSQITLEPDFKTLLKNDSAAQMSMRVLQRLIQIQPLAVEFKVEPMRLFLKTESYNMGKLWSAEELHNILTSKIQGSECTWVNSENEAEIVIQLYSQTQVAAESDWLFDNYNLQLANMILKAKVIRKSDASELLNLQFNDIFGYSNTLERAGMQAYSSFAFKARMAELLFEIKHKIFQY